MTQRLKAEQLHELVEARHLGALPIADLLELFRAEPVLQDRLPSGEVAHDPRNGARVLYAPGRGRRPHHTQDRAQTTAFEADECPICAGETTGVIDVAELSEGFTFINKNLYPMLYPFSEPRPARGLHLLQWTSSHHDRDWNNLPPEDCAVVMSRLAAVEAKFAAGWNNALPEAVAARVSIIKNAGGAVGASLEHGHQQIAVGGPPPGLVDASAQFARREGRTFSEHLLVRAEEELLIKDYGPALLLVAPFMKRPYEMFLVLKDTTKSRLHELTDSEIEAVAHGWHDASRALHAVMPRLGREVAYNVLTANGPGAGLYFEFLPYSQTLGGFERLGLYICQSNPADSAAELRRVFEG